MKRLFIFIALFILTDFALAGGLNKTSYFNSRTSALNGLYFAGVDGLSNIYTNPAGLSFNYGKSFQASYYFRSEQNTFDGKLRGLYKSITKSDGSYNLGFSWSFENGLAFGFNYQDNFDYELEWPYVLIIKKGQISEVNASDLFEFNKIKSISPAVSYKFGNLSAGLALNILNVKNQFAFPKQNYNWTDSISQPLYQLNFSEDGWGYNFNLGLMYEFSKNFRAGISVLSGYEISLDGKAIGDLYSVVDSASSSSQYTTKFQDPWKIGLGIFYAVNDFITLNIDFRFNLFGSLNDEINRTFTDNIWQEKSQIPDSLTGFSAAYTRQYYNNTFDLGLGIEYKVTSDLEMLFGYRFSQSPNSSSTFNMLRPTVSQHALSAGFVFHDNSFSIGGSVVYFAGIKESVNNSEFEVHNGIYDTSGLIPTITIKYDF